VTAFLVIAATDEVILADVYIDYGFRSIDNSAGGSVLDGNISQEFWTDTNMRWLGTQFRLELDQGTIFQAELNGTGFIAESNHDVLANIDPALAFDTRIGVNGQAPPMILSGAPNLGGMELLFTDTVIDIAYGPGGGNVLTGPFDFGTFTLSEDATGRGALLLSSIGIDSSDFDETYGYFARLFEVDHGVIRLIGDEIPLNGRNVVPGIFYEVTSDLQLKVHFSLLGPGDAVGPVPAVGELIPYLPEFMSLAGVEWQEMTFYADGGGAISVPLMSLSEDAVTDLVATGNWAVQGENLVFAAAAVPEPESIALAVLAVTAIMCWQWQRIRNRCVHA
jgi:hypothetical protein